MKDKLLMKTNKIWTKLWPSWWIFSASWGKHSHCPKSRSKRKLILIFSLMLCNRKPYKKWHKPAICKWKNWWWRFKNNNINLNFKQYQIFMSLFTWAHKKFKYWKSQLVKIIKVFKWQHISSWFKNKPKF